MCGWTVAACSLLAPRASISASSALQLLNKVLLRVQLLLLRPHGIPQRAQLTLLLVAMATSLLHALAQLPARGSKLYQLLAKGVDRLLGHAAATGRLLLVLELGLG